MNIYKKLVVFSFVLLVVLGFAGSASAMMPTLYLASSYGDSVSLSVNGDANSSVTLFYPHSSYGYGSQSAFLGYTNSNGFFSSTISASSYNISQGATVYVTVNNQQSTSVVWPSYYNNNYYQTNNTSGLIVSNLNLSVGNSITLASPNGMSLYVSSNSNPSVVGVNNLNNNTMLPVGCYGGSQYSTTTGQSCYVYQNYNYQSNSTSVTLSAVGSGSSSVTLCQTGNTNACSVVNISVVGTGSYNNGSVLGASTCSFYRTLKLGMTGTDVSCLQSLLASKGYLVNAGYNSYFDLQTKNAVMIFQQDNYLYADGIVGRRTASLLYN
ncbi:MAG: peptidoglycan-binding domain-containing protein [Candidatus Nomurabacteria bacterium]|nr:peptidoglycan-binding domain-containing protein [Candidatus Nomurabacteria bacterium]